ncbi:MAG: ABC transporter substrate-binding protein [bacterium]
MKIGLLITGKEARSGEGLAAKRAAEMAIAEANANGGFEGRPFKLIVRSLDGPWASGSKEIVKLIFEDRVRALMSSLDGRSAHLAEQIVTKARVAMVASRASDPSLTQINIPWIFRCVPDDRQQAEALIKEIYRERHLQEVAIITANTYDAKIAATTFSRVAVAAGHPRPRQFSFEKSDSNFQNLLAQIERAKIEAIVLFGQTSLVVKKLVQQMRSREIDPALFGPLTLIDEAFLILTETDLDGAVFIAPGHWRTPAGKRFGREFEEFHGSPPAAVAAYAYDGMGLIVEAIKRAGLDRQKIRDALASIEYQQGMTGAIGFDASGQRQGVVHLFEIVNGRPGFLHESLSR